MIRFVARSLRDAFRYRLHRPAHLRAWLRSLRPAPVPAPEAALETHLEGVLEWILRAARTTGGRGVPARYTLREGWLPPYPETTGYTVSTLFAAADRTGDLRYRELAEALVEWLLSVQLEEGAFPGGHLDGPSRPVVFNTGQILIGLLAAFRRTGDRRFVEAALRAGRWLAAVQDPDGAWRQCTYKDRAHAYHTRVAWPLAELGLLAGETKLVDAARANLDFSLTLQDPDGWFRENTLDEEPRPFTHTLAYVTRGLLEGGLVLREAKYLDAASRTARAMLDDFQARGRLAGAYGPGFEGDGAFSCLTGDAQTAIVWFKLARIEGADAAPGWREGARRLFRRVLFYQDLVTSHPGIRGAVPGSQPLHGPYIRFGFPNWAAKFTADAILLALEEEGGR